MGACGPTAPKRPCRSVASSRVRRGSPSGAVHPLCEDLRSEALPSRPRLPGLGLPDAREPQAHRSCSRPQGQPCGGKPLTCRRVLRQVRPSAQTRPAFQTRQEEHGLGLGMGNGLSVCPLQGGRTPWGRRLEGRSPRPPGRRSLPPGLDDDPLGLQGFQRVVHQALRRLEVEIPFDRQSEGTTGSAQIVQRDSPDLRVAQSEVA